MNSNIIVSFISFTLGAWFGAWIMASMVVAKESDKCAEWKLRDKVYEDNSIGYEWYCSNCNYIALDASTIIDKCRNGTPYNKPNLNYCPKCGYKMS